MKQRGFIDRLRETLRLQSSYNIITLYMMDMALDRGWIGAIRRYFVSLTYGVPRLNAPLSTPVKVRLMLQDLGPIYVKVGQLVSSQSQALPPAWSTELDKLQSTVRPFPYELVVEIINAELGAPPEELYASFDPKPLAAASLAQVHRATLKSGEEVVVKVQRPNIQKQVKADVGIMEWLARLLSQRSRMAREMDLVGVVDEFGRQVLIELDYRVESYNAIRLNENLKDISGVRLPVMYHELSSGRVLTMEYVDGFKIIDIEAIEAAGFSRVDMAEAALRSTIKQIMVDGFFHGDLHPGNVLVSREDGTIIYLDTGMVGELDVRQRANLVSLLTDLSNKDVRGLAKSIRALSTPFREVDERAFKKDFERRIGYQMQIPGVPFAETLSLVMNVMREHGLTFDPGLILAVKSIMQMEAIGTRLFAGYNMVTIGSETTRELVREQFTGDKLYDTVKKEVTYTLRDISQDLPSLTEATRGWLNQYKKGRFEVYLDTSGFEKPLNTIDNLIRLLVIGIIISGIIVGSAIATGIAAAYDIEHSSLFTTISFVSYIVATVLGAVTILALLVRVLWRRD